MPFQTNIFANIPLNNLAERILCHSLNITEKHDIHYNGHYALNNSYNACSPKIYPYCFILGARRGLFWRFSTAMIRYGSARLGMVRYGSVRVGLRFHCILVPL